MSKQAPWVWLQHFLGECRSTAALEFALIAPLLILLGLGAVEFSAAVRAEMNINRAARYVAGILQNQTSVSPAQLTDYFTAAQYMYANGGLDGTLALSAASIKFTNLDTNANATALSYCTGWDASNDGATPAYTALPAAALTNVSNLTDSFDNDSTIIVEARATVTLPFIPSFYGRIPTSFTFTAISRVRPRYVLQIPTNPSPGFSLC
jgi:Flp pilus assembly protein TadG